MLIELTEAAVKIGGGASHVDHGYVIGLLGEIVVILKATLVQLKLVVKADLLLHGVACTLKELAQIVAGLLIVSFICVRVLAYADLCSSFLACH